MALGIFTQSRFGHTMLTGFFFIKRLNFLIYS